LEIIEDSDYSKQLLRALLLEAINIITQNPIKVCILGGGFGGLYTAIYLSSFSWVKSGKCEIILVEPKDNFLFSPLLYEILTDELRAWEIAPSYSKLLQGTNIQLYRDWVTTIDLDSCSVSLASQERLTYDYLVLSVGSKTKYADIEGLQEYALTFRTLADAELLKTRLQTLLASGRQKLRIAIIGSGPNGVELACKVADYLKGKGKVCLLERSDKILKNFGKGVVKAAKKALRERNIEIYFNTSLKTVEADRVTLLYEQKELEIPVDLVLWTAGTESLEIIDNLPCQKNPQHRLLTRPSLQLIDYSQVFALGDVAEIRNGKKLVPATAQAAFQQASQTAKNLRLLMQNKQPKRFSYFHIGDMLTLGKGAAIVSSFGMNLEGKLAAIMRRFVYIFRLPTVRHRLQVLKNILSNLFSKM
jgi:demethylphylloquinone reductase